MEKIVISPSEVAETKPLTDQPARLEPTLPEPVPRWAKFALAPLVLILPVLCVVAVVLRAAMRGLPPRARHAWTGLLATLLTASGLLTSVAVVLTLSFVPLPSEISRGLSELDERIFFPTLPATAMTAKEIAEKLKPLVAVVAPLHRSWFTRENMPSNSFGAGVLLRADAGGYTFVTARHVVDGLDWASSSRGSQALVAMSSGTWSSADVIARHKHFDLLLLRVPRQSGQGNFTQPLAASSNVSEGENIFVIGHPEGLRFTLSNGIISRTGRGSMLQITAPVSPGNSGGPVFDDEGDLVGIVTSMIDKHGDPNAENLNFAVRADALLQDSEWEFSNNGRKYLTDYLAGNPERQKETPAAKPN